MWLTLIVLMWGSAFPLVKVALLELAPVTLGFLRFLIATPILLLYSYLKDGRGVKTVLTNNLRPLLVMGMTGVMGYQVFQNIGVEYTSATNSSIIISSNPIVLTLLSIPLLKEKVSATRALGMAIGFSGVLTIILSGSQGLSPGSSSLLGDVLSFMGGLSWAIYSLVSRRRGAAGNPIGLTAASTAFGTLFLILPMFILENPRLPTTITVWAIVVILGLGASCLAYTLWNKVLSEEEASKAGISLFLIPAVTATLSVLLLSEPLTLPLLVGMGLVLAGVFLAERSGT